MTWTPPKTWNPNDVLSATDLNTYVRDNIISLLTDLKVAKKAYAGGAGADVLVTSNSFVDTDSTNHALSATLTGGFAIVTATFRNGFTNTTGFMGEFDIKDDVSGARAGDATHGLMVLSPARSTLGPIVAFFVGLAPGTHKFTLQARVTGGGGTVTVFSNPYDLVLMNVYYF